MKYFAILVLVLSSLVSIAADEPKKDFSQEPFVIEKLANTIHFEADGTSKRRMDMRVRVQSDAALKAFGQLVLPYNSETEKPTISGRVIKADGTEIPITESAIQDL